MNEFTKRLDEAAARAVMVSRLPQLLGSEPGCEVKDWHAESVYNPHVAQALSQAVAARRTILAEIEAMGWQCVPRVPTDEMRAADIDPDNRGFSPWRAMLSAAPKLEG